MTTAGSQKLLTGYTAWQSVTIPGGM